MSASLDVREGGQWSVTGHFDGAMIVMKPLFLTICWLAVPAWAQHPVSVRVLDATGAPLPHAVVEVQTWGGGVKLLPAATTGEDGTATFSLPLQPDPKKPAGRVVVAAPGFAFAGLPLVGEKLEIRLEKGVLWRGRVVDEAGKPVESAAISISGAMPEGDWERAVWLVGDKIPALYTAKSGADGSFQIEGLPAAMELSYGVKHPKFAVASRRGVGVGGEETVKLAPGGAIRGRILDTQGKPLGKTTVFAVPVPMSEGGNRIESDENGHFHIESLGAGRYRIGARLRDDAAFVVPEIQHLAVAAGATSEAPELRAIPGVEIRGLVREAATQKPLAGASVIAQQTGNTSASRITDAAGRFALRVAPGNYNVYLSGPPQGFLRPTTQKSVAVGAAAPAELVWELQPAVTLRGVTVDEAGKPLAARLRVEWDEEISSDENGAWEYTPRSTEALRVAGGDDETGYFEVISPERIEPAERGAVTVRVRKVAWNTLAGRAVSPAGKPLQGVQVAATFLVPLGLNSFTSTTRTATSDAQGQWVLPRIREGRELKIDGKKAGLELQKGGEISKTGVAWMASDLVFATLDRTIEGTTAPDARVVAMGREVVADAQGKFKFEGLAAGDTLVFAAKDGQFGANLNAAERIELQKQGLQGVDENLARQIWGDVARDGEGKGFYALDWVKARLAAGAEMGDQAVAGAVAKAAAPGANFKARWGQALKIKDGELTLLRVLATWDGKTELNLVFDTLEALTDPNTKIYGFLVAATRSDDKELGARAIEVSEADFARDPKTAWWRVRSLYRAVVVAQKWEGEQKSAFALNRAIAYTMRNHGATSVRERSRYTEGRDEMYGKQAPIIAKASPELLLQLIETIEPGSGLDIQALAESIPLVAKIHGAPAAITLLDALEKMPEPTTQGERPYANLHPEGAFGQAALPLVALLGQTAPDAALTLARRVKSQGHRPQALAAAARFQSGESAAKLWREAVEGARGEQAPQFAAQAWQLDPKLGTELFAIARARVEGDAGRGWGQVERMWAAFAWHFARVDPAEARLILEKNRGAALARKADGSEIAEIAHAMSAIDAVRAVEMARAIPADERNNYWSLEARRKIGQYVAASEAKRRDFDFNRWGASDAWDGEPNDRNDGDFLR